MFEASQQLLSMAITYCVVFGEELSKPLNPKSLKPQNSKPVKPSNPKTLNRPLWYRWLISAASQELHSINVRALIIRIGFGAQYTINTIKKT